MPRQTCTNKLINNDLQVAYPYSGSDSWSNWNLEMLVFEERGKPEYPEKNLSEQGREPTTNSTHILRRRLDLNPGHIGGRRVLSPLHHTCYQQPSKIERTSVAGLSSY